MITAVREFDTEDQVAAALRANGYQPVNESAGIWAKDGWKVKIVRDGFKGKYFTRRYGRD